MNKKSYRAYSVSLLVSSSFIVLMVLLIVIGLRPFGSNAQSMNLEAAEDSIIKCALQCYVTEGSYPPDIEYMVEHYGLIIDEDRYYYEYDIFASNVAPSIKIIPKNQ